MKPHIKFLGDGVCFRRKHIPLKQKIGIGTISNAVIIASTIDLFVYLIPFANSNYLSIIYMTLGILLVGVGSGFYLTTNLGPGTRDGLRFKTASCLTSTKRVRPNVWVGYQWSA